ncbi:MAG: YitT family protein [Bacteroidetes bacterium]|nr:MAG: YitT family protein [Bacteroidota bacterium]REK08050.1 MAG: YitT family protein [Bacteroidota bacterium]REK32255.1 MAG: YitT family protein [Bacteroidota bacterium]REK47407.1 MAG: YitT family protein [Bacteroidota bacterium]
MNRFWTKLVIKSILKKTSRHSGEDEDGYSSYELAKGYIQLRKNLVNTFKDIVLIALGITSAAFGLKGFLLPNSFIDGGATGISLLIAGVTNVPLPVLLLLVNLPFIFFGYRIVGKQFSVMTVAAISGLALATAYMNFPEITHDKLLVAVFGGFFLGAGIGLSVRGGAVIDGTEVLAIFLSRKLKTTIGDIIMIINILIFTAAAYLLSIETALYSMITYLAASRTVDFVIEGIEEYTGITIISSHSEEIREMISVKLGRGLTVYKGKRGFGKQNSEIDILYTVITRLEISKLSTEIESIDPNAFVIMNSIKDTKGGMIKKRPLKS